eukprot:GHVU01059833.1.p1 GENE.GHVU01059833.1~~GHVU01059833.1.p1  ORF type:complete len:231 (-),score=20.44 GHVU01059833.1:365-1057(-)
MSAPVRKTVEIFYDVVSPYAWIGFEIIHRYKPKWNLNLELKPFFLGGIMQGSNNKPPGLNPSKGQYLVQDVERMKRHYQIPLNQPSDFLEKFMMGTGTLSAMRLLTYIKMTEPQHLERLSRELWMRVWSRDETISSPEDLTQAGLACGLSESFMKNAVNMIKDADVKANLKANTEEALEYGAFGAPTYIVHTKEGKQMIWGSDRMHIIGDLLGERYEGPLTEASQTVSKL